MNVIISGSVSRSTEKIEEAKKFFESMGCNVVAPTDEYIGFGSIDSFVSRMLEWADCLVVVSKDMGSVSSLKEDVKDCNFKFFCGSEVGYEIYIAKRFRPDLPILYWDTFHRDYSDVRFFTRGDAIKISNNMAVCGKEGDKSCYVAGPIIPNSLKEKSGTRTTEGDIHGIGTLSF